MARKRGRKIAIRKYVKCPRNNDEYILYDICRSSCQYFNTVKKDKQKVVCGLTRTNLNKVKRKIKKLVPCTYSQKLVDYRSCNNCDDLDTIRSKDDIVLCYRNAIKPDDDFKFEYRRIADSLRRLLENHGYNMDSKFATDTLKPILKSILDFPGDNLDMRPDDVPKPADTEAIDEL